MTYKAALIGCGLIGYEFDADKAKVGIYTHAAAYHAARTVELFAVVDPDIKKLNQCGDHYTIPAALRFNDVQVMLDIAKPDIVSIASPDETHAKLAELALNAPSVRAILLEKPIGLDLSEAQELCRLAASRDVLVVVNYSRRFCPVHQSIFAALRCGDLGPVQAVQGIYSKGIKHNGTHWLDLFSWFFGPVSGIRAEASSAAAYGNDPTPHVFLRSVSGLCASLTAVDHLYYGLFEMDILCERGRIRLLDGGHRIEWYETQDNPYYTGYKLPVLIKTLNGGAQNLLYYAVENVIATLNGAENAACTDREGLYALSLAEKCMISLRKMSWVEVNECM